MNGLIETLKDGQEGFRQAAEAVKDTRLKALFSEYSLQRSKFAGELQNEAIGLGERDRKIPAAPPAPCIGPGSI